MLKNKFIKHERSMDICCQVLNQDESDIYVMVWNLGQTSAYPMEECFTLPLNKVLDGSGFVCQNDTDILENNKSFNDGIWQKLHN